METDKLEGMLIDYIDGRLSAEDRLTVERELDRNPEAAKVYHQLIVVLGAIEKSSELQPGPELRADFAKALQAEIRSAENKPGRIVRFSPVVYRAAAAVLLVLSGIAVGYWITKNQEREAEITQLRKDVEATKHMMMAMLENTQSASQRVMGASVALKIEQADDQIVIALTRTMNEDPNTNVRLAALEALGKFRQQDHVRNALIGSLSRQKDPVVQIALIRLLVEMKEKEVVRELQRITNDRDAIPAVKDEAHAGILKLS